MNKDLLLPKLAVVGIRKNGSIYFPYIVAGVFSVFIFFVFSSIIHNDIMKTLPRSTYVITLMQIGLVLLGGILIPFLVYTNSFLIKQRKKELGLYSILGLEKKHISIMMFWESLIIFSMAIIGGIVFGIVFSRLLFLILLNLTRIPIDTTFAFSFKAFKQTFLYFLAAYGFNLLINLIEVFRSNPNELIKGAKKGDQEPKRLWITAVLGVTSLAVGYYIAIIAKIDSMIFLNFFLAVAFVIFGTHKFFTAGIIALLKIMKRNKKLYYHQSNYVTISGMLHRMKKSASSLANICIFSTMTIITLLCTLSLWWGTESILYHQFPYDITLNFNTVKFNNYKVLDEKLHQASQDKQVEIKDKIGFAYLKLDGEKVENSFIKAKDSTEPADHHTVNVISLEDYNQMEQKQESLLDHEVMVFTAGSDFGYDIVRLGQEEYKVKKELEKTVFSNKAINDVFGQEFYFIVKDEAILTKLQEEFNSFAENSRIYTVRFQIEGMDANKEGFINEIGEWSKGEDGFNSIKNGISDRQDMVSMNGGLLFLGIFFGIIFSMCLILIMYYKQIIEGFADRENFNIMQKVGMSDKEVRKTIKRQILMVFFLPLLIAIAHIIAAFGILSKLLGVLYLFNTNLIITCGIIVLAFFMLLYSLSYLITSKTYYGIVKQMH